MKTALVAAFALAVHVTAASAEPPRPAASDDLKPDAGKAPAKKAPAKAKTPAKAPAKAKTPAKKAAPDLRVTDKTAARAIDLFPPAVLGKQGKAEKRPGLSLGDDGDWKVQAAQVGAMVGIFGALVGLCGGGACTIPSAVTDPLPSWLKAKPYEVVNPRPPQDLPKLR